MKSPFELDTRSYLTIRHLVHGGACHEVEGEGVKPRTNEIASPKIVLIMHDSPDKVRDNRIVDKLVFSTPKHNITCLTWGGTITYIPLFSSIEKVFP